MLLRLLALLRRPRATDILLHRQRLQFDRLQSQMEVVLDGLRRDDISVEDLSVEDLAE